MKRATSSLFVAHNCIVPAPHGQVSHAGVLAFLSYHAKTWAR